MHKQAILIRLLKAACGVYRVKQAASGTSRFSGAVDGEGIDPLRDMYRARQQQLAYNNYLRNSKNN